MSYRLSAELLESFDVREGITVELPTYDRSQLKAGIVHIGLGNFSLAHIAHKTHNVMQAGDVDALNYGIMGVSLVTPDRHRHLAPQDGLYTVVEKSPETVDAPKMTIVGSVMGALYAPEDPQAVIDQIASPNTRIVSMTITPQTHQSYMTADGLLNDQNPDIANDLNPNNPPKTIFGFITRALSIRHEAGLPGITVMNLDNMEHNGDVLRGLMEQFAELYDPRVAEAVRTDLSFPNSMVDRIVPGSTQQLKNEVSDLTAFVDASPVPAEPMPKIGSWVLEDNFKNGSPAWAEHGQVQIVPNVLPYEQMKLRLLNVSHAAIANAGDLAGYTYIDEVMADPLFREFMAALMDNETGTTLPDVPGIDLEAYKAELIKRFSNSQVKDTTWRVSKDAPLKVVLDSAQDLLDAGGEIELVAFTTAAWMRRFRVETNEIGVPVSVAHPMQEELQARAREGCNNPALMFELTEVFGSIGQNRHFVIAVSDYMLLMNGHSRMRGAMEAAISHSKRLVAERRPAPQIRPVTASSPAPDGTKSA